MSGGCCVLRLNAQFRRRQRRGPDRGLVAAAGRRRRGGLSPSSTALASQIYWRVIRRGRDGMRLRAHRPDRGAVCLMARAEIWSAPGSSSPPAAAMV